MREEFGRAQDLAVVELAERLLGERDFGNLEAGEMRGDIGQAGQHRHRDRLKHGVGRRGQHAETNASCHRRFPALYVSDSLPEVIREARDGRKSLDWQLAAIVDRHRAREQREPGGGKEHQCQEI